MTAWKVKYTALSGSVGKLKDMLGTGNYCITRVDREPMGLGEMIMLGDVLANISGHLLPKDDYELREKEPNHVLD